MGRGTFVQSSLPGDGTTPAEIMAVRLLLEPQMLALAVANATVPDIALMRSCL